MHSELSRKRRTDTKHVVLWGHLFGVSLGTVILAKSERSKDSGRSASQIPETLPRTQVWEGITSVDEAHRQL